eukprot:TRINITY_DN13797_c0_g1_i1.p1 TRINITY_DN13797_c0_g1~~TRINITY_DN13797_c0_g1_i1.p1  ORF type:complete len:608 (-),score=46.14 TRINITY_DN13797_c0_g1_i1:196-1944(-)
MTLDGSSEEVSLTVLRLDGDGFLVSLRPEVDTVAELQRQIEIHTDVVAWEQCVIIEGCILDFKDQRPLASICEAFYDENSTIFLSVKASAASQAFSNYKILSECIRQADEDSLDWKARAKVGVCFMRLSEYQQAWDNLKLAVAAAHRYKIHPNDEQLVSDKALGKYFRILRSHNKQISIENRWTRITREDAKEFVALLVADGNATDLFKDRFDQVLPSWWNLCHNVLLSKINQRLPQRFRSTQLYWDVSGSHGDVLQRGDAGNRFHLFFKHRLCVEAFLVDRSFGFDFDVQIIHHAELDDVEFVGQLECETGAEDPLTVSVGWREWSINGEVTAITASWNHDKFSASDGSRELVGNLSVEGDVLDVVMKSTINSDEASFLGTLVYTVRASAQAKAKARARPRSKEETRQKNADDAAKAESAMAKAKAKAAKIKATREHVSKRRTKRNGEVTSDEEEESTVPTGAQGHGKGYPDRSVNATGSVSAKEKGRRLKQNQNSAEVEVSRMRATSEESVTADDQTDPTATVQTDENRARTTRNKHRHKNRRGKKSAHDSDDDYSKSQQAASVDVAGPADSCESSDGNA